MREAKSQTQQKVPASSRVCEAQEQVTLPEVLGQEVRGQLAGKGREGTLRGDGNAPGLVTGVHVPGVHHPLVHWHVYCMSSALSAKKEPREARSRARKGTYTATSLGTRAANQPCAWPGCCEQGGQQRARAHRRDRGAPTRGCRPGYLGDSAEWDPPRTRAPCLPDPAQGAAPPEDLRRAHRGQRSCGHLRGNGARTGGLDLATPLSRRPLLGPGPARELYAPGHPSHSTPARRRDAGRPEELTPTGGQKLRPTVRPGTQAASAWLGGKAVWPEAERE